MNTLPDYIDDFFTLNPTVNAIVDNGYLYVRSDAGAMRYDSNEFSLDIKDS